MIPNRLTHHIFDTLKVLVLYLDNPSGRAIPENSQIKELHETTKRLNEKVRVLQGKLYNELNRQVHEELLTSDKNGLFHIRFTNIDKELKYFMHFTTHCAKNKVFY